MINANSIKTSDNFVGCDGDLCYVLCFAVRNICGLISNAHAVRMVIFMSFRAYRGILLCMFSFDYRRCEEATVATDGDARAVYDVFGVARECANSVNLMNILRLILMHRLHRCTNLSIRGSHIRVLLTQTL